MPGRSDKELETKQGQPTKRQRQRQTIFRVVFSTASGALVVGGVRDIYIYIVLVVVVVLSGDRFECSMEYNQSVSGSQWQSVVVCGSLW